MAIVIKAIELNSDRRFIPAVSSSAIEHNNIIMLFTLKIGVDIYI
jgi:hypothetical protein